MNGSSDTPFAPASNASAAPRNGPQGLNTWQQFVLQRLAAAPLRVLADALDRDESSVCRIRSGETRLTFHEALALIEALSCKAVDRDAKCIRAGIFAAFAEVGLAAMSDRDTMQKLLFESIT